MKASKKIVAFAKSIDNVFVQMISSDLCLSVSDKIYWRKKITKEKQKFKITVFLSQQMSPGTNESQINSSNI